MENDILFDYIQSIYKLNKAQVYFANFVLKELDKDYSRYNYIRDHEIRKVIKDQLELELTNNDISYTFDRLEHDLYFIDKHFEHNSYKITHSGKEILQEHGELLIYFGNDIKERLEEVNQNQQEKNLKDQIDNLTLRQLKGTIFQVNKWWLFLLINAGLTIIVSVIVALIIKKMGLN